MNTKERPPCVVVGVDGSPASHAALEWAADAAARRGVRLRIVHGLGTPTVMAAHAAPERLAAMEELRESAHGLLADSVEFVRRTRPEVDSEAVLVTEEAPGALLDDARHGDIIVVGSRGLGAVRAIMLGSVSVRASSHAPCPVVIVPPHEDEPTRLEGPPPPKGRIVVGVDGSDSSHRALRFGLHEAAVSDSAVVVVNSWEVPLPADTTPQEADSQSVHEEVFDRQSEEIIAGVLAEVIDDETQDLDISAVRMQANAVEGLLKAGEDADLIVVGSRGRGGVRGLVMGSVSQGLLHHARVPVAVLPPHSDETE